MTALKKVIELVVEDLYNCAKSFAKSYITHRKKHERFSITAQLQITFQLADVSICGIVDTSKEDDVVKALKKVDLLFEKGTRIIEMRELSTMKSVIFLFDPTSAKWVTPEDSVVALGGRAHVIRWGLADE